ncbi:MAG: hypothetical protein HETSPECPRED_002164 [Heterodermia speciosa]|uniref:DUF985 domain-containing protein n=1 Tax=Heterodermia speciosa TaxID=116794 RepID=A0A8H3PFF7_9LECA|nr:MAG: hypothetical protein HETSPECPRED_002164 [Heterodermia speciosa]
MSTIDASLPSRLTPDFPNPPASESPSTQHLITTLSLQPHPEGGFFIETDRDQLRVPNPFPDHAPDDTTRCASTSIFYLLTPGSPKGSFHRNKGRTIHTLHRGRGRYVIIHADEGEGGKKRVETFVVGQDVGAGERLQWVVEGGKFKASYLLAGGDGEGLLISETVVPGFEFSDHDFMTREKLEELVEGEQAEELGWLLLHRN